VSVDQLRAALDTIDATPRAGFLGELEEQLVAAWGDDAELDVDPVAAAVDEHASQTRNLRWQWILVAAATIVVLALGLLAVAAVQDPDRVQTGTVPPTPEMLTSPSPPVESLPASLPEATADQLTTSGPGVWAGPVRAPNDVVQHMAASPTEERLWTWQDPVDASVGWIDVTRATLDRVGRAHWYIELAAKPPLATELEPGLIIAYGLVLDTTGDGAADYLAGIDNDASNSGDFRVWVTDLATGETEEQIGPPYGFPMEFSHPDEREPNDPFAATIMLEFVGRSTPADLDPETVRFYAWTSATRDGDVIAWDYAPDAGWMTSDTLPTRPDGN